MAYKINDDCISCGSCAATCQLRQSARVLSITKSTQTSALSAVLAAARLPGIRNRSSLMDDERPLFSM